MAASRQSVPFQEAIDFLQRKVNLPTQKSDDLRHAAHVRAFSVAGVTRDDMLADFRAAIEKARVQGTTLEEFRKDFDAIVERTGWKYYARGKTEEQRRAWRTKIIFNTNMRTSYMAGRFAQMTDPDVLKYRPFWRYKHGDSKHPRKYHLALDGMVFAADDPMWKVWYPPNGWGCQCDVEALSKRQMKALGKEGPDARPAWMQPYAGKDPRTGQTEERWPGVDRGWEYNVGEASLSGPVPVMLQKPLPSAIGPKLPLDLPELPPAHPVSQNRILAKGQDAGVYADAFLGEFGASRERPQVWRDPSGGVVTIDKSLFEQRTADGTVIDDKSDKAGRGPYMLLLADALKDPDEIWVDWVSVASGFALRRTYLRRVVLPGGSQAFVRFEWSNKGWYGTTAFPATKSYIERARTGALLFRRK